MGIVQRVAIHNSSYAGCFYWWILPMERYLEQCGTEELRYSYYPRCLPTFWFVHTVIHVGLYSNCSLLWMLSNVTVVLVLYCTGYTWHSQPAQGGLEIFDFSYWSSQLAGSQICWVLFWWDIVTFICAYAWASGSEPGCLSYVCIYIMSIRL